MTMTSASSNGRAHHGQVASSDRDDGRPRRRRFTAEYKLNVLEEYEAAPTAEARGALLRREGLYTSHISEWRRRRDAGALEGLTAEKRPAKRTPEQVELEKLRRRNERLEDELRKTKLALDITGKAHALLELLSESADSDPKSTK